MSKNKDLFFVSKKEKDFFWKKVHQLPQIFLNERQLFDFELLAVGGFYPLKGFLNEKDYKSVLNKMRIADGSLWPIPIVLDVSTNVYKKGDEVVLADSFGNPLGLMNIESVYVPDKEREAQKVFGTTDMLHPGVKTLFRETGNIYLGGSVSVFQLSPKYDFKDLRKTPKELKDYFKNKKIKKIIGFQTRNPIHRAHFELIRSAANDVSGHVLIHPVVGITKEGDIDYITRIGVYKKIHELYAKEFSTLSLLPLAMRMGGPREAVWHALIRKNYGCTHFIVGRDHAGPGKNSQGDLFYGPYDAQKLVKKFEKEIGLKIITKQEVVYVEEEGRYISSDMVLPHHTVRNISGTTFRNMLRSGEKIPEWFSFPEVIEELRKGVQKEQGFVLFFTGLSGSGKSTIAHIILGKLREKQRREITFLDGDVVRKNLSKGLSFSREDRNENIKRIGFVASEVVRHGGIAICSAIAPFKDSREYARNLVEKNGSFIEIYLDTPVDVCEKRDVKGLYKKARKGVIKGFTGIDDPYEIPINPDISINTEKYDAHKSADMIMSFLQEKKLI